MDAKEFGIDIPKIIELFCPNDNTYISAVTPEVEEILIKLWELFDIAPPFSISQMKIYVLALFSLLQNLNNIPPSQACTFFTETQVDIAKRVEKLLLPICGNIILHGNWQLSFLSAKPA